MSEHEKRVEKKLDRIITLLETLAGEIPAAQREANDPLRNVKGLTDEQREWARVIPGSISRGGFHLEE